MPQIQLLLTQWSHNQEGFAFNEINQLESGLVKSIEF